MASLPRIVLALSALLHHAATVFAAHSVVMENFCGTGTPILDQMPSITLITGADKTYTNETVTNAFAFLNTGGCGPNGGHCTAVAIELGTQDGGSSSVVIDLIPTHEFTVSAAFEYFNGCDGAGTSCLDSQCTTAETTTPGIGVVTCQDPNASVKVTFCPDKKGTTTTSPQGGDQATTVVVTSQDNQPSTTSSTTSPSVSTNTSSSKSSSSNTTVVFTPTSTSSDNGQVTTSVGQTTTSSDSTTVSADSSSSSTTAAAAASSGAKTPVGAIAGGVVGGIVVLGIIAALIFCLRRRREQEQWDMATEPPNTAFSSSRSTPSSTGWRISSAPPPPVTPFTSDNPRYPVRSEKDQMRFMGNLPSPISPVRSESAATSRAASPITHTEGPQQSYAQQQQQPVPPAEQQVPSAEQSVPPAEQQNLDQIIEGLAQRFGWTAPGRDSVAPPIYDPNRRLPSLPPERPNQ